MRLICSLSQKDYTTKLNYRDPYCANLDVQTEAPHELKSHPKTIAFEFQKTKLQKNPYPKFPWKPYKIERHSHVVLLTKYLASVMACNISQVNWMVLVCYHNSNYPFLP